MLRGKRVDPEEFEQLKVVVRKMAEQHVDLWEKLQALAKSCQQLANAMELLEERTRPADIDLTEGVEG